MVRDVIEGLARQAPHDLAAPWDHVGLQVGSPEQSVRRVYIALDPTLDSVQRAIKRRCQLLITHHPIYLTPPKRFDFATGVGETIALALRHRVSIYAAHTNLDAAHNGLNDYLCTLLALENCAPLVPTVSDKSAFYKLVTFVPVKQLEKVAKAVFAAGAGRIGNYENCSFRIRGTGTYLGNDASHPTIGKKGQLMQVEEERLEVLVSAPSRQAVEQALRRSHPYEEIAFDWVPLAHAVDAGTGLGRVGVLPQAMPLVQYCKRLKTRFKIKTFRLIGNANGRVKKVALCSGSGASFIEQAAQSGADLYITGDVKYHDALLAQALGLSVADLGHFATEHWAVDLLAEMVQKSPRAPEIVKDRSQTDPFIYI